MSDSSGSDSDPPPPGLTASGRPARAAVGKGDATKPPVAFTPHVSRAHGSRMSTPETMAAAEAAQKSKVAAAFAGLVQRGFQHTVLRDPRPGPGHDAVLGNVWTLESLPGDAKRAVAEALQKKDLLEGGGRGTACARVVNLGFVKNGNVCVPRMQEPATGLQNRSSSRVEAKR
jgi:hypothetical protein